MCKTKEKSLLWTSEEVPHVQGCVFLLCPACTHVDLAPFMPFSWGENNEVEPTELPILGLGKGGADRNEREKVSL